MGTRTRAYQGLSNVSFLESFAYLLNEWLHILHTEKQLILSAILTNSVVSNLFPESAKLNQFHCRFGISNTTLTLAHWKDSRKVEELLWKLELKECFLRGVNINIDEVFCVLPRRMLNVYLQSTFGTSNIFQIIDVLNKYRFILFLKTSFLIS